MSETVNGRKIADGMNAAIKEKIEEIRSSAEHPPRLVSLVTVKSEDAEIYVNMQRKAAELVGIEFSVCEMDPDISREELAGKIEELNSDSSVTSIIVEKPLPEGIGHSAIVARIRPEKDAEGVHPYNLGKILRREADIVPCTPGAVMKILSVNNVDLYGKEVVIMGHSAIVGKPLSLMMLNEMATTTVCHLATAQKGDIKAHAKKADILIVAVGKAGMVKGDWVKEGAVVIDVGINRENGGIVGDVDFSEVAQKASMITPVPGGVGPITVSILMRNVLRAYRQQNTGA